MSQAPNYDRLHDFTQYQLDHAAAPYNGADHDAEFNSVAITLDALRANAAEIQRDDGALANNSVHPDALSAATKALIAGTWVPRGLWVTATSYAVGDIVEESGSSYVAAAVHVSGVFATDHTSGKWVLLNPLQSLVASSIAVTPTGNLSSGNVQGALDEHQGDIDGINATLTTVAGDIDALEAADTALASSISFVPVRNRLIGSNFSTNLCQRGTTFIAPSAGDYTLDRWRVSSAATSGVITVSKATDHPSPALTGVYTGHCLFISVSTADTSIAAGDYMGIGQRIEGKNVIDLGFGQSGTRWVVLDFCTAHSIAGIWCVRVGNSAGDRSYIAEYTQNLANVWERKTVVVPVDTQGTWLYDNGIGLHVTWTIASGGTFAATAGVWGAGDFRASPNQVNGLSATANVFRLALPQLVPGQNVPRFDMSSAAVEDADQYRYYWKTFPQGTAPASSAGTTGAYQFGQGFDGAVGVNYSSTPFPVTMRTTPTMVGYNPSGAGAQARNATAAANYTSTVPTATPWGWQFAATGPAGGSLGQQSFLHVTADAEL